jgi:chorismate mutase
VFRAAFKPTPSIAKEQDTVNLRTMENAKISVPGRHDPCIVPRALPALEAAAALAILDAMLENQGEGWGADPQEEENSSAAIRFGTPISEYRQKIDAIDERLAKLFAQRMDVCAQIGEYKRENGLLILDEARERERIARVTELLPDPLKAYGRVLWKELMDLSKDYQRALAEEDDPC